MWREDDDDAYGCEEATREAVIAAAERELEPGARFEIIEARMSTAPRYEGSDWIPLLHTRNHEVRFVPHSHGEE
jgi:hypothetical protein